ncbi:MAG: FAD-binding protein [Deltaproteobacteria bacterium]|nr:FAD-binding protein [Deltaproteobacteria bacterium]
MTIEAGWGPLRVVPAEGGGVAGIELGRCLALCDETGRFSPCLDPGDRKVLPADTVILAVGQAPDRSFAPPGLGITGSGTVEADPLTGETTLPGVFAGGDVVSGPATVVKAIAAGKRAAVSIDRYLRGEDLREGRNLIPERVKTPPRDGIPKAARRESPLLPLPERAGNFREVALGFDEELAYPEAGRCMTCGSRAVVRSGGEECRLCQACERNCPQKAAAILPAGSTEPYVRIADSWEEIAAWIGADAAALKATVNGYNAACDRGHDSIFAKDRRHLLPLRATPYYAIKLGVEYLDTIGGIKINERMEVLSVEGSAIPGLYAAGIDTGGWVGDTYCVQLAGTTFAFSINSGRIAGENAAQLKATRWSAAGRGV